ncbi:MAG: TIGR04282 family arsenosugar biosynthesis glycosyltransferase [Gammaproteobacteria bacterium]|nr:TIGR04282 family arsenosugar biosynthesis glycosyltransferase [Gammaproteobacteria bacterium]
MTTAARRALLVFARNPVAGQVKTRLARTLGDGAAAAVYRRMLERTLNTATRVDADDTAVWLADGRPDTTMRRLLDDHGLAWHRQHDGDLGARMRGALRQALRGADRALLIGSDCPEISPDYLHAAFAALERADVVLGPAADGGYVMIGVNDDYPPLFERVPWGGDSVLRETRARLAAQRLRWQELATLRDVDEQADLDAFAWLTDGIA